MTWLGRALFLRARFVSSGPPRFLLFPSFSTNPHLPPLALASLPVLQAVIPSLASPGADLPLIITSRRPGDQARRHYGPPGVPRFGQQVFNPIILDGDATAINARE
jgi:hypothetical protein